MVGQDTGWDCQCVEQRQVSGDGGALHRAEVAQSECADVAMDDCIEESTGTAKEDVYNYYCRKFLSRVTIVGGHEVTVNDTSSMLNTVQMSEFMTKIQADAASEMGITLPLPADRYYEEFINEYKK